MGAIGVQTSVKSEHDHLVGGCVCPVRGPVAHTGLHEYKYDVRAPQPHYDLCGGNKWDLCQN